MSNNQYRSCKCKRRFRTSMTAQKALNRGMKTGHYSANYHIYDCSWCNGWHIGKDRFYKPPQQEAAG